MSPITGSSLLFTIASGRSLSSIAGVGALSLVTSSDPLSLIAGVDPLFTIASGSLLSSSVFISGLMFLFASGSSLSSPVTSGDCPFAISINGLFFAITGSAFLLSPVGGGSLLFSVTGGVFLSNVSPPLSRSATPPYILHCSLASLFALLAYSATPYTKKRIFNQAYIIQRTLALAGQWEESDLDFGQ